MLTFDESSTLVQIGGTLVIVLALVWISIEKQLEYIYPKLR